jgi:hypothetical protein
MDDQHAQFLLMCEDICHSAFLADITVELTTRDGRRLHGVPRLSGSVDPDSTSWSRERVIELGQDRITLGCIVKISVATPSPSAAR